METLGKIINSVLTSLIVSIILFVIMYSLMTGEFPPNLARLKKSYQGLHKMAQVSREIHDQDVRLRKQYATTGNVNQEDVDHLQALNLQRMELGASMLGGSSVDEASQKRIDELEKRVSKLEAELKVRSTK